MTFSLVLSEGLYTEDILCQTRFFSSVGSTCPLDLSNKILNRPDRDYEDDRKKKQCIKLICDTAGLSTT